MAESLRDRIKRHEGLRLEPYEDAGGQSIGYGCRLPLTPDEADALFEARYTAADDALDRIDEEYDVDHRLSAERDGVLVEMCYQLGERGVRRFKRMLAALADGDYNLAADEILDSDVARKQPERWGELARIMRTGSP